MKRLGLLRHAKSDWDDVAVRDFERGLNARGRAGAALMGRHIRAQGDAWDAILASPADRVKRTLEASGLGAPVLWQPGAYLADAGTLLGLVRKAPEEAGSALLVGHNPGLHELLLALVAREHRDSLFAKAAEKFPTAAYAVLELGIDRWTECQPGCGKLVHFARPRDLDPELGPEE